MQRTLLLLLILIFGVSSCRIENTNNLTGKVPAYKPIYSNAADLYIISNKPARAVTKAGKIYVKGNYIFQNEIGEGIHIIDNSNPANAVRTGFIRIAGSEEIAIKGNILYANNFSDLVVIDIADAMHAKEVNRIKSMFFNNNIQLVPPQPGSYFECADNTKGVVTGWVLDSLVNPKCRN